MNSREQLCLDTAPASEAAAGALIAEVNQQVAARRYGHALSLIDPHLAGSARAPGLLFARASVLFAWGRFREACEWSRQAEAAGLRDIQLFLTMGWSCIGSGNYAEAEPWMRRAADAERANWKAYVGLGAALRLLGRPKEAGDAYERALALKPDDFDCSMGLVFCCLERGDLPGAEMRARQAIALHGERAVTWANLGVALARQDRHAEAKEAFERAGQLEQRIGEDCDSYVNAANNLRDGDCVQAAIALYEQNLAQRPSHHAHGDYGMTLLTAGRLIEGWNYYEFRWLKDPLLPLRPGFRQPVWAGQDLSGKTILLRSEQGFGDTIQFIRYAPYVKALGATVLLQVRNGFGRLAARFPGIDTVLTHGEAPPRFDFYIHLLSLPRVFGTDLGSIPAEVPYLQPDPADVARWADRLRTDDKTLKVGVVWAGSPTHGRDRHRSIPPETLAPLRGLEGVHYFGLQKSSSAAEMPRCPLGTAFFDLGPQLQDFADTAAAIAHLDLVLCADTAVAHLAGAQGKQVWLMLPRPADFRWMEDREDSPWYPDTRLFRQSRPGDWNGVVARVRAAMEKRLRDGDVRSAPSVTPPLAPVAITPPPMQLARLAHGHRPGLSAVAETRQGIIQYFPDEPVVGDSICWYGEYLQPQLDLLGRMVRPGATLMELGAGVGVHSLFLSAAAGSTGHLFVNEPRPLMQRVLLQNFVANRVANVTCMRRALGIDETLDELRLEHLDLLKIEEAADARSVLEGATNTLWGLRPLLFIAARDKKALSELAARARDFGYCCWRMETALFNPHNFNSRGEDIFAGRKDSALLAIPEEIEVDIVLDGCDELP